MNADPGFFLIIAFLGVEKEESVVFNFTMIC